jgi:hypothetical protein
LKGRPDYYNLFNIKKLESDQKEEQQVKIVVNDQELLDLKKELKEMKLKNKELTDMITSQSMKFIEDTCLAKKYWEESLEKLNLDLTELKGLNSKLNCELYKMKSQLLLSIEQNNKAIKLENDLNKCIDKLQVQQYDYEQQMDALRFKRIEHMRKLNRLRQNMSQLMQISRFKTREIYAKKLKFFINLEKQNAQFIVKHIRSEYIRKIAKVKKCSKCHFKFTFSTSLITITLQPSP